MNVKFLVQVTNTRTHEIYTLTSANEKYAIRAVRKLFGSNDKLTAEFVNSPCDKNGESYRVTHLCELPRGCYFRTLSKKGKLGKTVYVKDVYDHSENKYECYKFHDVCSSRLFDRHQLVVIDFTF